MIITSITLYNFRNFRSQTFALHPQLTIIVGENTRGKTSLLESVYCLIRGTGFRESREEELIHWEEETALAHALFTDGDDENLFQMQIKRFGEKVDKTYYVNKAKQSSRGYLQYHTKTVLFAPEHISIINGSPSLRRSYMDSVISSYDYTYKKRLRNYEHALRKRNKVLEKHRDPSSLSEELAFWDDYLIEQAQYISEQRSTYVDSLNAHPAIDTVSCHVVYEPNMFTRERLRETQEKERLIRKTLIGPQKDDFQIIMKKTKEEKDVHLYGSRSEQRLALFWLKLNEIRLLEEAIERKPVLLLDDVFSELDMQNKKRVMDLITQYQTILTTTERELLEMGGEEKAVIEL
jgi:DNA replication and repair protein RecF